MQFNVHFTDLHLYFTNRHPAGDRTALSVLPEQAEPCAPGNGAAIPTFSEGGV